MNAGSDKEDSMSEKKIKIKILSKTPENMLKLSEITIVDTKTRYIELLLEQKEKE